MILAGGRASRMGGGDKGLRSLAGRPILAHVIERLAAQADPVALNANGDPSRFDAFGLTVIADPLPDRPGPLAGVLAALDWARGEGADSVVTVAADTPLFPRDLVDRLVRAAEEAAAPIALAATRDEDGATHRHPTFGVWSVALGDDLHRALGEGVRKIVAWTDGHGAATAVFERDAFDPFFNINTPEDMLAAEELYRVAE